MSTSASEPAPARFEATEVVAIALLGVATVVKAAASLGLSAAFLAPSAAFVLLELAVMRGRATGLAVRRVQVGALVSLGIASMALSHAETLLMTASLLPIAALLLGMRAALGVAVLLTIATAVISAAHGDPWRDQVQWTASVIGANIFLLAFSRLLTQERQGREALRRESVLAQELSAAVERGRIAADLHDGLGHYLTAALIQLEAARALGGESDRRTALVERARALIHGAMAEVRLAVDVAHPPYGSRPLVEALGGLVRESERSGLATRLVLPREVEDPAADKLSPTAAYALWRGVQEALTNARRHSGARAATVSFTVDPSRWRVVVEDDGCGARGLVEGIGLRGMRERLASAGGSMTWADAPAGGFVVTLEVPR